jgi:hypothetical protein
MSEAHRTPTEHNQEDSMSTQFRVTRRQALLGATTLAIDPNQRWGVCPNQDVVYGIGAFDLGREPIVFQVPDFRGRFWVYALSGASLFNLWANMVWTT